MNVLNSLFPNATTLSIIGIHLCAFMCDDILDNLSNAITKLDRIEIKEPKESSDLNIINVAEKYRQQFNVINFDIRKHNDHN